MSKYKAEAIQCNKPISVVEKQYNLQRRKQKLWALTWIKLYFKATASFNKGQSYINNF